MTAHALLRRPHHSTPRAREGSTAVCRRKESRESPAPISPRSVGPKSHTECATSFVRQVMTKSTLTLTQSGLHAVLLEQQRRIHRHPPLWTRGLMFKRSPSLFVRIQQVVVIAALAFVFWLGLGLTKDHASGPSYPYYDTQAPVPPWTEPATLKGNYDRK